MSPFLQWFCSGFCDRDQFSQARVTKPAQCQIKTKACQSMLCMFRFIFVGLLCNANNCNKHNVTVYTILSVNVPCYNHC